MFNVYAWQSPYFAKAMRLSAAACRSKIQPVTAVRCVSKVWMLRIGEVSESTERLWTSGHSGNRQHSMENQHAHTTCYSLLSQDLIQVQKRGIGHTAVNRAWKRGRTRCCVPGADRRRPEGSLPRRTMPWIGSSLIERLQGAWNWCA